MKIAAVCRRRDWGVQLLATALACAMVSAPALAASRATLGGKIVNAAGVPVRGIKVLLLRPGSDNVLLSTATGADGTYVLDKVEIGTYLLRVEPGSDLRGDTVKADITGKGLIVNWKLSKVDKAAALAIPGKVGGEESELCSPVQIGEYDVNRCYLAGGIGLIGVGVGVAVGLSGGGGGGGGGGTQTPTITGTRPTATVTGTRVVPTPTGTLPTATGTMATPTGTLATPTVTGTQPTTVPTTPTTVPTTPTTVPTTPTAVPTTPTTQPTTPVVTNTPAITNTPVPTTPVTPPTFTPTQPETTHN